MIDRFRVPVAVALALVFATPALAGASVATLIRQLQTRKAEKAASQLADLGKESMEALLEALRSRSWKVRYWAAYAIAYNKSARDGGAVEALKRLLQDRKKRVRLRAAMALARLGDKSGLAVAQDFLKHRKAHLRAEAVAALGASGDVQVVPRLKEALGDSSGKVRYWALIGLRDLVPSEALALGLKYISDEDADVKMAAMELLGAGGADNAEAEDALIRLLSHRKPRVRQYAVSVLARIGGKRSLGPLRKVRDSDRKAFVRDTADAAVVEVTKRMKR